MRRLFFPVIPLFVAAAVLILTSPVLNAQQEPGQAATGHTCACCGKSGSEAMNPAAAAGGGCCGNMASAQAAAPATDHSAHGQTQPAPATDMKAMEHGAAGGGCCGNMAMDHAAKQTDAKPMEHAASGGCCANMKMDQTAAAQTGTQPMDHSTGGGCCGSMAMGKGEGSAMPMAMDDASMTTDMQGFHFLLEHRADIRRVVTILPNGIDTVTESDKPEIAAQIKTHVSAMYARLKDGRPIHQRDPLFEELFAHADQIDANITYTAGGVHVVETSTDPAVALLLHKHAAAVDGFVKNGMPEMMKNHLE